MQIIRQLNLKQKCIMLISIAFVMISIGLQTRELFEEEEFQLSYEYVNVKDMAQANVATKIENTNIIQTIFKGVGNTTSEITEVELPTEESIQEVELPLLENTVATLEEPKQIWYLPTQMGIVSQNPHYGHVALDITSPRGSQELIFPVANGVISGIYTDGAGAKIVTVRHDINGKKYTSQYVHLSSYAPGLYVGKPVTINDCLGNMGTTGYSTGIHLHLAVVDCDLFNGNDPYCSDLNGFFRYVNTRLSQGYIGLGAMMWVPGSWTSR